MHRAPVKTNNASAPSNRIPKVDITLQDLLTTIRLLVFRAEIECVDTHKNANEEVARQHAVDTRVVGGAVLRAEYEGAGNASKTAETDQRGGAKGSFPVSSGTKSVILLIRPELVRKMDSVASKGPLSLNVAKNAPDVVRLICHASRNASLCSSASTIHMSVLLHRPDCAN